MAFEMALGFNSVLILKSVERQSVKCACTVVCKAYQEGAAAVRTNNRHKLTDNALNQSEFEAETSNRCQARENACV